MTDLSKFITKARQVDEQVKSPFSNPDFGVLAEQTKKMDAMFDGTTQEQLMEADDNFIAQPSQLKDKLSVQSKKTMSSGYEPLYSMLHSGYTYLAQIRYNLMHLQKNFSSLCCGQVGCLSLDSSIKVYKDGKIKSVKIKDLPSQIDVVSYNFDRGAVELKPAKVIKSGKKEVFKIVLQDGKTVTASDEHIFFKQEDRIIMDTELKHLKAGDCILVRDSERYIMYPERIVSIKKVGIRETYDLQVADNHNFFLANGILTHNSGKSLFSIAFSMMIDPTFAVDRIVFTPKQYLNLVKVIKKGQFAMWDEVGAGLGNRDFATKLNRNIGKVFQTQRYKQFGIIMTAPSLNLIDKQPRDLLHCIISMKKILRSYNVSVARIYENKQDVLKGKVRQVLPKVHIGNTVYKIREFAMHKPPNKIIKEYEKVKAEFFETNVLGKAIQEQMTGEDQIYDDYRKNEVIKIKVSDNIQKVLESPHLFGKLVEGVWRFETKRIKSILSIPQEIAEQVKYKSEYSYANR